MTLPSVVDGAVVSRASNYRRYPVEYKRRIMAEYDLLPLGDGSRGSLLRREGLRRNQIFDWRRTSEMSNDLPPVPVPKKRAKKRGTVEVDNDRLLALNRRLEAELARTRLALEITGKAHALLELLAESADTQTPLPRSSGPR